MGDFFRGWRRKLGCLMLVLACVVMAWWVRGFSVEDIIQFGKPSNPGDRFVYSPVQNIVFSSYEGISWVNDETTDDSNLGWIPGWGASPIKPHGAFGTLVKGEILWRWELCGFDFCYASRSSHILRSRWTIPYWSLTLPLTLISFWLLLTKHRKPIPEKLSEPIPVEGD